MVSYKEFLNESNERVLVTMENGKTFKIELFKSCAPITVANFLKLVDEGFYEGIVFHRVVKGFVIQGGDKTGTGRYGSDESIVGEFRSNGYKNDLLHTKGVISMARTSNPNSASSQIFIMHDDAPHLDGSYAGFGVVYEGIEVIEEIGNCDVDRTDRPIIPQAIKSIVRI